MNLDLSFEVKNFGEVDEENKSELNKDKQMA